MDCLNCDVSFHPIASIGRLCENLCTIVGLGVWYDKFRVQNRKWLLLVNDIVSVLNNNNVLCVSFRLYPCYVPGILHSVKEIHLSALCIVMFDYTEYIQRCITGKKFNFRMHSKITFISLP